MMKISKFAVRIAIFGMSCLVVGVIMPVVPAAFGQALPAAEAAPISTGFALPTTLGSLQYAVSASQSLIWGYYGNSGEVSATNLSGDVAYLSNSKHSRRVQRESQESREYRSRYELFRRLSRGAPL